MAEADEFRQFIRDVVARHERIWRWQAEILGEQAQMLEDIKDELRDTRDERRAQTRALLQIIDRLENGGAAA